MQRKNQVMFTTWMIIIILMVLIMIMIGGVTRLTDSGLSMVEWRPLLGVIPPISESEWLEVFNKYKNFPEYQLVNHQMNLSEFKNIFFWEYFHRLFGRLIGLVLIIPWIYLSIRKSLSRSQHKSALILLILGGSQGLLGWFMVKSGLVDNPDVSHFRLAAHLLLAFLIAVYAFWTILRETVVSNIIKSYSFKFKILSYVGFILLVAQIIYGAFVAGLKAGFMFNTWPYMAGSIIPTSILSGNLGLNALVNNMITIQFVHRSLGVVVALFLIYLGLRFYKVSTRKYKFVGIILIVLTLSQFALGVFTLLSGVNLHLAVAHQVMACILLIALSAQNYFVFRK